jgi:hypothetical protein
MVWLTRIPSQCAHVVWCGPMFGPHWLELSFPPYLFSASSTNRMARYSGGLGPSFQRSRDSLPRLYKQDTHSPFLIPLSQHTISRTPLSVQWAMETTANHPHLTVESTLTTGPRSKPHGYASSCTDQPNPKSLGVLRVFFSAEGPQGKTPSAK